ncbi:capsid cement protein [Marinobacter salarius]|uniref:capsid cement protein n=1 Tax=Marinobacter salarius TaxID=1420917 RepID=UPI003BA8ED0D
MATNYSQKGEVIDFTNGTGSDIASGEVVVVGNLVGVAITDIADTEIGAVGIEGVWELPKVSAAVIGAGETVNWDDSVSAFDDNQATPATDDLTGGCVAVAAAGNGDTTVLVKINVGANTVN